MRRTCCQTYRTCQRLCRLVDSDGIATVLHHVTIIFTAGHPTVCTKITCNHAPHPLDDSSDTIQCNSAMAAVYSRASFCQSLGYAAWILLIFDSYLIKGKGNIATKILHLHISATLIYFISDIKKYIRQELFLSYLS